MTSRMAKVTMYFFFVNIIHFSRQICILFPTNLYSFHTNLSMSHINLSIFSYKFVRENDLYFDEKTNKNKEKLPLSKS